MYRILNRYIYTLLHIIYTNLKVFLYSIRTIVEYVMQNSTF